MASQTKRNRRVTILRSDVHLDLKGNIIKMPITGSLSCFGDPVEYYRGEFDTLRRYYLSDGHVKESARGCAGCKSTDACRSIAMDRVALDPAAAQLRDDWRHEVQTESGKARYTHPAFLAFKNRCESLAWTSSNDDALAHKRSEDRKRKRKGREQKKRQQRRERQLTVDEIKQIEVERNDRKVALVVAKLAPKAPVWVRNQPRHTIERICDIWQIRQLLELRKGRVVKDSEIFHEMIAAGKTHGLSARSLRSRVTDDQKRIARLESEPADAPIWPSSY